MMTTENMAPAKAASPPSRIRVMTDSRFLEQRLKELAELIWSHHPPP